MSEFLTQARRFTDEKQFVMDVLQDNSYTTYLVNSDQIVRKMWSTPIRIDPPMKLENQLLTIYKVMPSKDFDEINLGARVYLKRSDQHYLYRGTCRKDRSENVLEFHVERADDIKCSWVNRNELDYWCKPIYAHTWDNEERIELYHVFGKKLLEFTVPGEKQTLVVGSFYYNIGEFIQLIEQNPMPSMMMEYKSVKTVVINWKKQSTTAPEPSLGNKNNNKQQKDNTTTATTNRSSTSKVVNSIIAKPSYTATVRFPGPIVKAVEKEELTTVARSLVIESNTPNCFKVTESTLIEALVEKKFNFKHLMPSICCDVDLMNYLIRSIALIDDQFSTLLILKNHQSKKDKPLNPELDSNSIKCVAQSVLAREIDLVSVFFTLLDLGQMELCKHIVTTLGGLEAFEGLVCLERHKINIDLKYERSNKIFTDCVRMILAAEDRAVDDENLRIKSLTSIFSLSEELTSRIIEDRNVHSHSQIKSHRLKGALEDRIQCLKQIKSFISKKKTSKKVQTVNLMIQTALDQFQLIQQK